MGWTIFVSASYWILAWVAAKIIHMCMSMRGSWDIGNGIGIAIVQAVFDVLIVLGVIGVLIGLAVHFVSQLV